MERSTTRCPIPGGWEESSISIGRHRITLVLPADPDVLLEHLDTLEATLGNADPYWARLWPTAVTMAQWVLERRWPADQSALELGCGVGLVGIAGLLAGLRITFSDYVPLAVTVARENARRNGFPDSAACVFDWRQPPVDRYAVILGSDIVYDPQQHEALLELVARMLAPNGTCWLGDPGRYHVPAFLRRAEQCGFGVQLFAANGLQRDHPTAGEFQLLQLCRDRA